MSEKTNYRPDTLSRFLLSRPGVRGALVRLDASWSAIRQRSEYPPEVARCLGETCAAAALFTSHIKMQGRLSVQLRGDGPLRLLFAECTAQGTLRGLAHWREPIPSPLGPRDMGEKAVLAIGIENHPAGAREVQRYQGLVGLDADDLAQAFEGYFGQSEQLPTCIRLLGTDRTAAALMIQQLPEGHGDPDGWNRSSALFATPSDAELAELPARELVWRLFHEEGPEWLSDQDLAFACSCSRERVADMLRGLGKEEALAAATEGNQAEIHCDFCGQAYIFDIGQLEGLFTVAAEVPGPASLQ